MKTTQLMAPKEFSGTLSQDNQQAIVKFIVEIDIAGEAIITLDRFELNKDTEFIVEGFHAAGTNFVHFCLRGTAEDGTTFNCEDIFFTNLGKQFGEGRHSIAPKTHYSLAKLTLPAETVERPIMTWRLKGFECFRSLSVTCPLGTVEISGAQKLAELSDLNDISGLIRVTARDVPEDVASWKKSADSLCEHLRKLMSFAACVQLGAPIVEFSHEGRVAVEAYSQSRQETSDGGTFSSLALREIFECAVKWHFERPFKVNNLPFAIGWFTMRGLYREANLITAMTVLENLIDSNLSDEDTLLLSEKMYDKLRKKLSVVVKEQVVEWTEDKEERQVFIQELNNRFADLKRRSLIDKINLLAKRWGVKLDGISDADIRIAKSARDQVVHRGYYEPKAGTTGDLYDHVLTIRELVVRFILTALQFKGDYCSYRGGYHMRKFEMNETDLQYQAGKKA